MCRNVEDIPNFDSSNLKLEVKDAYKKFLELGTRTPKLLPTFHKVSPQNYLYPKSNHILYI